MGRHSTYREEIAEQICARLAEGEFLRVITRDEGMPNWRTVYDWMESNPDFAARVARARRMGFDAIAEETVSMIDETPERTSTQFGDKIDVGFVQWKKNQIDQRMRLLSKWDPKRYGDKLALGGADDLPPIKKLTDGDLLARISELQDKLKADDGDKD